MGSETEAGTTMADVPDEVLLDVLAFLCPVDRERAGRVCRRFRRLRISDPLGYPDVKTLLAEHEEPRKLIGLLARYWDQADLERSLSEDPDDPLTPQVVSWVRTSPSLLLFYYQRLVFENKKGWVWLLDRVLHDLERNPNVSCTTDERIVNEETASLIHEVVCTSLCDRVVSRQRKIRRLNEEFERSGLKGRASALYAATGAVVQVSVADDEVEAMARKIAVSSELDFEGTATRYLSGIVERAPTKSAMEIAKEASERLSFTPMCEESYPVRYVGSIGAISATKLRRRQCTEAMLISLQI